MKGCLNRRVFCEPFHRAIYLHNPSQSITILHNPSQSFAIFRSTFAQRQARRYRYQVQYQVGYQDGHHRIGIRFERSHEHTCSNRNRIGAFLIGT